MKLKIALILITIPIFLSLKSQDRSSIFYITEEFCESKESPRLFKQFDTIVLGCDSMYLLNKLRYKFYYSLHKDFLEKSENTDCIKLINLYENAILSHENAFNYLLQNCEQTEKISLSLISDTKDNLKNVNKNLEYTQKSLDEALKTLEHANKLLKKERWNSIGQKILIGLGGLGAGILLGTLITN